MYLIGVTLILDFHGSRGPTLRGLARDFYDPSIEAENQLPYCESTLVTNMYFKLYRYGLVSKSL